MDKQIKNLIIGHAVGDSFLLPYEFLKKPFGILRFSKYGYHQSLLCGYGMTSDDTDHLLMTAQALLKTNNVVSFQKSLAWKLQWWLLTMPPGIGLSTLKSIIKLWLGFSPKSSGIHSSGNGPLMRIPIIALYFKDNLEIRNSYISASTVITHKTADSIAAAQGIGNLIAYIAREGKLPPIEELKDFLVNVDPIWLKYVNLYIDNYNLPLEDFLKTINCEKFVSGYIMHSALFILYTLYHSNNPQEAFELIIKASGDTDTIGAVVGSCMGLLYGYENLQWGIKGIYPTMNTIDSVQNLISKNYWRRTIMKNFIGIPIIFCHGIWRLVRYISPNNKREFNSP